MSCNKPEKINGLVQERRNSIANALELRLSCTNPSRCPNQCSKLSWKSCQSWSEFWEIQSLICKEMCKKLLVLTKICRSRTDGPALVSNTGPNSPHSSISSIIVSCNKPEKIDGIVQERCNSSALAMELHLLQEHNLLFESQYGFRKLHSTDLAALELIDCINKQIDQRKIPFSIFLDLSKAFDTLNHDILMKKLHYHGVRNNTLNWFHSYLTNRAQYTEYNETKSSLLEIETGVPQGSILGPLLFLIYVNDIHMVSRSLNFILYADDTTLTSPICSFTQGGNSSISKVSNLINSELTKISDWFAVNKLSLNAGKTKFMIFHNHQKIITQNKIPCLKINNTNIERVTEFNFLGLTINEHLTWKSHAAKVANKISRTLGVMNRLKRYCICQCLL